MKLRVP